MNGPGKRPKTRTSEKPRSERRKTDRRLRVKAVCAHPLEVLPNPAGGALTARRFAAT